LKGNWKDIFTIRADIAVRIAKELKAILSPEEIEHLEKKPTENSNANAWYSMYLSALGRYEEAISHIEHALDIDPFSQFVKRNYFYVSFFAGQKDKACQLAQHEMISNRKYFY
jgi:tetratricopeptide (TPR) repeat protein